MTEQDYQDVLHEARIQVAQALAVPDHLELTDNQLDAAIQSADQVASGLLNRFLNTYQQWWNQSLLLSEAVSPSPKGKARLHQLIDSRDEIRKMLLSYLNYARSMTAV